jgi:hypothetical protein
MNKFTDEYNKYFTSRKFDRLGLFEQLNKKYNIKKALYLGSHVHITPSLVYPEVVYVDTYGSFKAMVESEEALEFVKLNKQYSAVPSYTSIQQNYENDLDIDSDFDLLISQYAGFISRSGKKYLKKGGILVANNSHGDASMANLDKDYEFVAVANPNEDGWIISDNLDGYFLRKDGKSDDVNELLKSGKGPGYKKVAEDYVFRLRFEY